MKRSFYILYIVFLGGCRAEESKNFSLSELAKKTQFSQETVTTLKSLLGGAPEYHGVAFGSSDECSGPDPMAAWVDNKLYLLQKDSSGKYEQRSSIPCPASEDDPTEMLSLYAHRNNYFVTRSGSEVGIYTIKYKDNTWFGTNPSRDRRGYDPNFLATLVKLKTTGDYMRKEDLIGIRSHNFNKGNNYFLLLFPFNKEKKQLSFDEVTVEKDSVNVSRLRLSAPSFKSIIDTNFLPDKTKGFVIRGELDGDSASTISLCCLDNDKVLKRRVTIKDLPDPALFTAAAHLLSNNFEQDLEKFKQKKGDGVKVWDDLILVHSEQESRVWFLEQLPKGSELPMLFATHKKCRMLVTNNPLKMVVIESNGDFTVVTRRKNRWYESV